MPEKNKINLGNIRLSTIFKAIVLAFFFLILISYFFKESHPYINLTGLFFIGVFCLILFVFLFLSKKYPALLIVIFILICQVYFKIYPDLIKFLTTPKPRSSEVISFIYS